MNGLYSVITDSTCKGGGGARGVSRALTHVGIFSEGGPKKSVKGGPHNFLCRLKNMLKYAHRGGGGV